MAIITHRHVQAILGVELTAEEVERCNRYLIPWATAEAVALMNRSIETTEVVGESHSYGRCWSGGVLPLNYSPVLSISEVRLVGTTSDVVPVASYRVAPWGVQFGYAPLSVWWGDQTHIEVDYTAGLVGIADAMRGMVEQVLATAVARAVTTGRGNAFAETEGALGVNSLSVEGYSVSFSGDGGGSNPEGRVAIVTATVGMFEPSEVQALQRLRRRVIA